MSIDGYFLLTRKNVNTKKDTIMKHIIVIALLLACTLSLKAQQYDLQRMAISSGFQTAAIGNNVEVIGIAGQAIIDTADARRVAKAGLIYIQETTSAAAQRTILNTPEVVHAVGDTFDLDIDFSASCLLFRIPLNRAWSMKVSFNKTILEPLAYDSIAEDADRYTISVHGTAASDATLLTRLRFLARLGNDSVTDVRIESFTWIGSEGLPLAALPGKVTLRGLCNTYGTTRLITAKATAAINVAPNPITNNQASFQLYCAVPTVGELVITDLQGNVVLRRDNVAASPEWPITQVEFGDIASGTLAAALITPHGVGRITILKLP
jgi:hypothetical protein